MNYISNFGNSFHRLFHGSSKNYEIQNPIESALIQRQMADEFGDSFKGDVLLSDHDILLPTDTVYKKFYKLAAKKILSSIIFGISMFSVTLKFISHSNNFSDTEIQDDAEPCELYEINSNVYENIHSINSKDNEIDALKPCKVVNENEIQTNDVKNESEEKSEVDGFEIIDYPPIAEFCNVFECNVKEKHLHLKYLKNSDGFLFKNEEDKEIDTENNIIVLEGKLKIAGDSRAAVYIIPKIHFFFYLKIETLVLCDQVLTLNLLKYLLIDSIKNLEFHGNSIFDNDTLKTLVPVEVLLQSCPNIEKFKMDCFGYKFTVENLKNIAEILSDDSKNLRKFYLYKLSSTFSLSSSMYAFIVNNFQVDLCLYYEDTVKSFTDLEIKNFDLLFKRRPN